MKRQFVIFFLLSLLPVILAIPGMAHGVRVFAWSAGDTIKVEVAFRGGRPARKAEIAVLDPASGEAILTGATTDKGLFQFPIPDRAVKERLDLQILADCGAGHRGQWLLEAKDYLEQPAGFNSYPEKNSQTGKNDSAADEITATKVDLDEQLIRRIVSEELDKKLAPIKRMIHERLRDKADIIDIIGGVGWLLGLAGIAAWYKAKTKTDE